MNVFSSITFIYLVYLSSRLNRFSGVLSAVFEKPCPTLSSIINITYTTILQNVVILLLKRMESKEQPRSLLKKMRVIYFSYISRFIIIQYTITYVTIVKILNLPDKFPLCIMMDFVDSVGNLIKSKW